MTTDTIDRLAAALAASEQRERSTAHDLDRSRSETKLLADFLEGIGIDHRIVLERYWIARAAKLIGAHFIADDAVLDSLPEEERRCVLMTCRQVLTKDTVVGRSVGESDRPATSFPDIAR